MINLRRFDLPLEETAPSRFLPWGFGALVYIALVALAVAAMADSALRLYGVRSKLLTVTLPSVEDARQGDAQMAEALDVLTRTRGVTSAVPVPADELEALIQPWLGNVEAEVELPLPRLIDVTLDPLAQPDLASLQERLGEVVDGATIGIEAITRDRTERLAAFCRAWGTAAGVVALLAALGVVAMVTRLSLQLNTPTVELLRCMGAPDKYLARQFERHALLSGLRGGAIGFGLAVLTILALLYSGQQMELSESIELSLRPLDWLLLACVPLVSTLLITAIARMFALWGLSHSP